MRNNARFRDINKISAIAGIVALVVLVIGLIVSIVIVSIHTNAYITYSENRVKDLKIEKGISVNCPNELIRKASNAGDALTVKVEVKNIKKKNTDAEGKCIYQDFGAKDEYDCEKEMEREEEIVTISKIKKDFEVIVTNDYDESVLHVTSDGKSLTVYREGETEDEDYEIKKDSYSFISGNQHVVETYTLTLQYSKGSCQDALIREMKFETPMYNMLAVTQICEGKEDYDKCKKYVYSDNPVSKESYSLKEAIRDIEKVDIEKYREEQTKESKTALIIVSIIVIILLVISISVAVIGVIKVRKGGALHENEIDENYDEDSSETFDEFERSIKGTTNTTNENNNKK